jgi:hypothetical protein
MLEGAFTWLPIQDDIPETVAARLVDARAPMLVDPGKPENAHADIDF